MCIICLEKGASHSYVNQCVSALKFLFHRVLKYQHPLENLPRPQKEHKLPTVLSQVEILLLLNAVKNLKHQAIMLLTYSGGLRLGEVVRLEGRGYRPGSRIDSYPSRQAPEGSVHDALQIRPEGGARLQVPISTPNMAISGCQTGTAFD